MLLKLVILILGRLPFHLRGRIGAILGRVFSYLPSQDSRITELQLKVFLPTGPSKHAVYAHLGRTIMESINLQDVFKDPDRFVECPDWPTFPEVFQQGCGALALSAHTGNWDLMACYFAARGIDLTVIGKEAQKQSFQDILTTVRERSGIKTIWRADLSSVKKIISIFKSNQVVAALIDQDTTVTSDFVPFFGVPAHTPNAIIYLALKANTPIVSSFCRRLPSGKYEIRVSRIHALDQHEVLLEYNSRLEAWIRQYPDQWVWVHKRWRSRENFRMSSKQYITWLEEQLAQR